MTDLPFVGRLNTVFVVAIALGMGVILFTMILNMITSFKTMTPKRPGSIQTVSQALSFISVLQPPS